MYGCPEKPDDGRFDSEHCYHRTGKIENGHHEELCCWCGHLFLGAVVEDEHGPHVPRQHGKPAKKAKAKTPPKNEWRCAACDWVGVRRTKKSPYKCPMCRSPDVFENIAEEWAKAKKQSCWQCEQDIPHLH